MPRRPSLTRLIAVPAESSKADSGAGRDRRVGPRASSARPASAVDGRNRGSPPAPTAARRITRAQNAVSSAARGNEMEHDDKPSAAATKHRRG